MIENAKLPGRNEPCPCGSGQKFKRCCWKHYQEPTVAERTRAWVNRLGGPISSTVAPSFTSSTGRSINE